MHFFGAQIRFDGALVFFTMPFEWFWQVSSPACLERLPKPTFQLYRLSFSSFTHAIHMVAACLSVLISSL